VGNILLGIPNSGYIILDSAGYGYKFETTFNRNDIRTKDGTLFSYVLPNSDSKKWDIPLKFVNSSQVSHINSWWSTATDLRYIEDDSFANSYYAVRIVGKKDTITKFVEPYFRQRYEGSLVIETI